MRIKVVLRTLLLTFFLFFAFSCEKDLYLIEVMPTTLNVEIDSTYQFSAVGRDAEMNVIEDLTFTWTSRYPEVGTVDQNGLFTAISSGLTFLTAKSGTVESAQVTVSVYDPVFSIEIEPNALTVYVDSTAQFTAVGKDINGNDITELTFTWESGNTSITTVYKEGIVTGITPGNTTVTAKLREVESLPAKVSVTYTVTDIDGNVYQTVKIGKQLWTAENLKATHYRNGDAIPNVTDAAEWSNLTTGAYCEYENKSDDVETYGRLYNWYAVNNSRNIAPEGWHVPSDEEWKQLEMFLGMSQSEADDSGWRGTDEGSKLKSTSGWSNFGNGTDDYAFAALPGGYRSSGGTFGNMGSNAGFWSSAENNSNHAWLRGLYYYYAYIGRYSNYKHYGFSVRLVRD